MRRTLRIVVGLAVMVVLARSALAQSPDESAPPDGGTTAQALIVRNPFQPAPPVRSAPTRPMILPPLYAGFGALQAFDAYTTTRGVRVGAAEANPFFEPFAAHPGAVWAMKAGITTGAILASEQLWRHRHRAQAIAVMVVSNTVMSLVAAHNVSVSPATP